MSGVFRSQQAPGAVFGAQVQLAGITATATSARSTGTATRSSATQTQRATAVPALSRPTATPSRATLLGGGLLVTPANATSTGSATRSRAMVLSQLPSADRAVYQNPQARPAVFR